MAHFTIDAWLNKYLATVSANVVFRQMFREHLKAIEAGAHVPVVFDAERMKQGKVGL